MIAVEIRKRPVIKGTDVMKFLQRTEQNKKRLEERKALVMKKWNERALESQKY